MKDKRLIPGIKLFEEITGRQPKQVIFLTGYRDTYMLELPQLDILKFKNNSNEYKDLYSKINKERDNKKPQITVLDMIIFFKNHNEENIDNYIDKTNLLSVLNKFSKLGVIELPENVDEVNTLDILDIFAQNIKERELGYLAILDSELYKQYRFNHVYTNDTNNTTGTRANTQDTIIAFSDKYWMLLDESHFFSDHFLYYNLDLFKKTLFISNDALAMQQHIAIADALLTIRKLLNVIFNTASPQNTEKIQNLNPVGNSFYCALNVANHELSDNKFNITTLQNTVNRDNASKINIPS